MALMSFLPCSRLFRRGLLALLPSLAAGLLIASCRAKPQSPHPARQRDAPLLREDPFPCNDVPKVLCRAVEGQSVGEEERQDRSQPPSTTRTVAYGSPARVPRMTIWL